MKVARLRIVRVHNLRLSRPCELGEDLPARDGGNAENAGAIFCHASHVLLRAYPLSRLKDVPDG